MKKVITILLDYLGKEVPIRLSLALMVYSGLLVYLQYSFNLKFSLVNEYFYESSHVWRHFLFFFIPMLGAMLVLALFGNRKEVHWSGLLIFLTLTSLAFTIRGSMKWHREFHTAFDSFTFGINFLNNVFTGPGMLLIPVVWWWFVDRKDSRNRLKGKSYSSGLFYGMHFRRTDYKAYFMLLMLMVPLVALASTQKDFIAYYPKAAKIFLPDEQGAWWHYAVYELLYGFDFVYIEFFFRGFLVLGMARFIGPQSIPMAAVFYCTIHFGKPIGETISSYFGGMVLGTLALETGSVLGGIIVHMGIAWLMEFGGFLGRLSPN